MKVLVSAASRHGATADIAKAIGETLEAAGLEVAVLPPDTVTSLAGFDAVILGSGVYVGHWMEPAKGLVERFGAELSSRPVWLFSSGPVGDPPKPEEDPADLPELMTATGARGHRLFPGSRGRLPPLGRDPGVGRGDCRAADGLAIGRGAVPAPGAATMAG